VNFRNAPQAPLAENLVPLNQFRRFRTQIAGRVNLEAQAHALRDFDQAPVSLGLYPVLHARHDRIILTGMGASHVAAFPSWRRLVSRGKAAWWIDAASLLENPQLVTSDSLVIATSRSGMCAGVAALVERFDEINRPAAVVAITDNLASPLAEAADCELLLRSQSSGNAKGFLNALAAHDYVAAMILNEDNDDPSSTARVVAATRFPIALGEIAAGVASRPKSRLAYIGFGEHTVTALYAALLTNETTSFAAEGFAGGDYRDELMQADACLTAVLFGGRDVTDSAALRRVAGELVSAGSTVVVVGDTAVAGATQIGSFAGHVSAQVAHGVVVAEHFVSSLAAEVGSALRP
jgi:fructoselysine-6-P-deglycase FrlB-like protein